MLKTVDDLNREDITIAYFTGTPPETWAPTRFPKAKLKGVAGLGRQCADRGDHGQAGRRRPASTTSPGRSSQKQVPGLVVVPAVAMNACRARRWQPRSGSRSTRRTPAFHDWLQAVYDEVKDKVTAEEMRLLKGQ